MEHFQQVETVRRFVIQRFAAYGADCNQGCTETILVRDSHYCGRRFSCSGWRAVWFVEEQVIKFFDTAGGFRETLQVAPTSEAADRAA